jgi:hypothetical protein
MRISFFSGVLCAVVNLCIFGVIGI